MEAKHTKGPWGIVLVGDKIVRYAPHHRMESLLTIVNEGGVAFAAVREEADAHLIAAAPELLEALEALLADGREWGQREVVMARSAIAKAKGKA